MSNFPQVDIWQIQAEFKHADRSPWGWLRLHRPQDRDRRLLGGQ
jgi:hypothetical protein